MANLGWFVEEALNLAGIPHAQWEHLPQEQQIKLIQDWQTHIGTPVDFVKKANFQPEKKKMALQPEKPKDLPYDDFAKSKKLVKLTISFGDSGERTILAGIHPFYDVPQLINTQVVAVLNLAPREMMGMTSHGMILAAHNQDGSQLHLVQAPGSTEGREVG